MMRSSQACAWMARALRGRYSLLPALVLVATLAISAPVAAHAGTVHEGGSWTFALLMIGLLLPALAYLSGQVRLARRGRASDGSSAPLAFWSGWITLCLVLAPPMDGLGGQLFWVHMVQHEVLMLVSAPLLILSRPQLRFAWGVPASLLRALSRTAHAAPVRYTWNVISRPWPAWSLHALAVWLWHAPPLFDAAIASEGLHILQHVTFFGSALLFWWSLLRPDAPASAFMFVFTTLLHTGFLGMLLTFSTVPWYAAYATSTASWGLTQLEDQQLGGLVMWVPAGVILLGAGLALVARLSGGVVAPSARQRRRVRPG